MTGLFFQLLAVAGGCVGVGGPGNHCRRALFNVRILLSGQSGINLGHNLRGGAEMPNIANRLLACFIVLSFAGVPLVASARSQDNGNSGVCKSGVRVSNIKNCKENGGRK